MLRPIHPALAASMVQGTNFQPAFTEADSSISIHAQCAKLIYSVTYLHKRSYVVMGCNTKQHATMINQWTGPYCSSAGPLPAMKKIAKTTMKATMAGSESVVKHNNIDTPTRSIK